MSEPGAGGGQRLATAGAVLLLAVAGWTGAGGGAAGAERLASRAAADVVLVSEGDVVADDLYAAGRVVTVNGRVEGDLFFWASSRMEINGEVTGNVTGAAGTMRINGRVGGSVRVVGWDLAAAGTVGRDLFGIGWRVAAGGEVGRDVLAWARNLAAGGTVGRDIVGQAWGTALLSGEVGRDVEITVDRLRAAAGADIAQDLVYRSPRPAAISEQAAVGGNLIRRNPLPPNLSVGAARTAAFLTGWLFYMIFGVFFIWRSPTYRRAAGRVRSNPWSSLGWGAAALLGGPSLAVLTLWTVVVFSGWNLWTALGIFLVGVALALLWAGWAALLSVPALNAFGRWAFRGKLGAYGGFALTAGAVGLLILFAPFYFGPALWGAAALFGAGGRLGLLGDRDPAEAAQTK